MKEVYSKNDRAEKVVGLRDVKEGMVILDIPGELGFSCPVCKNEVCNEELGMFDERLEWSEYNGFLWCSVCNFDFLTILCVPNLDTIEGCKKAIDIFLKCISVVVAKKRGGAIAAVVAGVEAASNEETKTKIKEIAGDLGIEPYLNKIVKKYYPV